MTLTETCGCGATFRVKADDGNPLNAALSWRQTHRHEVPVDEEAVDGL